MFDLPSPLDCDQTKLVSLCTALFSCQPRTQSARGQLRMHACSVCDNYSKERIFS